MLLDPIYIDFWLKVAAVVMGVLFVLIIALLVVLDYRLKKIADALNVVNDPFTFKPMSDEDLERYLDDEVR